MENFTTNQNILEQLCLHLSEEIERPHLIEQLLSLLDEKVEKNKTDL